MKTSAWLKGLIAAFVSSAANSITNMIVAPDTFNLHEGMGRLGATTLIAGIIGAALYLKQSPVPAE
jgi:hypothetical protein